MTLSALVPHFICGSSQLFLFWTVQLIHTCTWQSKSPAITHVQTCAWGAHSFPKWLINVSSPATQMWVSWGRSLLTAVCSVPTSLRVSSKWLINICCVNEYMNESHIVISQRERSSANSTVLNPVICPVVFQSSLKISGPGSLLTGQFRSELLPLSSVSTWSLPKEDFYAAE